jgi:hypothetical protein
MITAPNCSFSVLAFWIYAQSGYYQGVFMAPPVKVFDMGHSIFTNSVIADGFNREKDNVDSSMDYSHSYGMRVPDDCISLDDFDQRVGNR